VLSVTLIAQDLLVDYLASGLVIRLIPLANRLFESTHNCRDFRKQGMIP